MPKNDKELFNYMKKVFGFRFPYKVVVPGNSTPFKFIADMFFERVRKVIAIGPRGGSKTQSLAALHTLNSNFKKNCETASVGAVELQAQRCYRAFSKMCEPFDERIKLKQRKTTVFLPPLNTVVEILPCTMNAMNSPHPQKTYLDEFDLAGWTEFQEFLSMKFQKENLMSQTVLISTRKKPFGPAEKVLMERKEMGYELYLWSIWEVSKKCERNCSDCEKIVKGLMPDGSPRSFRKICNGKMKKSDGFREFDDIIDAFRGLDIQVWDSQYECRKAQRHGAVFYWYDEDKHYQYFEVPSGKEKYSIKFYLSIDWGGADPNVCLFWFERRGVFYLFDELWLTRTAPSDFAQAILNKLKLWGINLNEVEVFCDRSSLISRLEISKAPYNITTTGADNDIDKGISIINSLGVDDRIIIHKRCEKANFEFTAYSWPSETNDRNPGNKPMDKNNHCPDAARYLFNMVNPIQNDGESNIERQIRLSKEKKILPSKEQLALSSASLFDLNYNKIFDSDLLDFNSTYDW